MSVRRHVVEELHRGARRNFDRRKYIMRGINETLQADLIDMKAYEKQNSKFNWILTVIDNFSKYAWAVALKSKNGKDVTSAFESILKTMKIKPRNLQCDNGKEFYNSDFKKLMKDNDINLYSTYSNIKGSIIERFNRTLKTMIWKEFSYRMNNKWIDILSDLLRKYNNRVHSTTKLAPGKISKKNEKEVLQMYNTRKYRRKKKIKFKIGDSVRVSKFKQVFEKGYTPNYSNEIFTIRKVIGGNPTTYLLHDYMDREIMGGFYEQELTSVKYPDVYLIEKIIKKRGENAYVKWLGFDNTHNGWIPLASIEE